MDGTILIADDDRTIRTVLTQALTRAGCKVHATSSLVTLMRWVEEGKGDLVISDVVMPDGNGIEQLPQIAQHRPGLPVIVISAQNTIMTAIQATEADAYDYLPKPFDLPDLMKRVSKGLDIRRRRATGRKAEVITDRTSDLPLVGHTPVMQELYRLVARVMNTALPTLVLGESGTGKSLIANATHNLSDRHSLPFVNIVAADFETIDGPTAKLAQVKGGTLLFDEIGDFDDVAQARVVRILDGLDENGPRIMATSQSDLSEMIADGKFREDLYYRLAGVIITVPALRVRVDDIPPLAEHFLFKAERDGAPAHRISAGAMDLIRSYSWPGNVRQLENVIGRLIFTSVEEEISQNDVRAVLGNQPAIEATSDNVSNEKLSASVAQHLQRYFDLHEDGLPPAGLYNRILREIEAPLLEISLDATGGNQAKCADLLGINRNTLRKKITELDIRVTRRRKLM